MEIGRFYDFIFSITELDPIDSIGWLLSITVDKLYRWKGYCQTVGMFHFMDCRRHLGCRAILVASLCLIGFRRLQ